MTAPHIGNTGINDEDPESSRIWVAGYVVRDPARVPVQLALAALARRRRCATQGVVGISGIDTRALTRHLRERGAMRVGISIDRDRPRGAAGAGARRPAEMAGAEPRRRGLHRRAVRRARRSASSGSRVAALDLGIKANTPRMMAERGIEIHVLPATATLDDVLRGRRRRAVLLQRPRRPGRDDRPGRAAAGRARARASPTSASASATSSSAGRSASAPTSSPTATAASTSR